jgi:hypothetical protein
MAMAFICRITGYRDPSGRMTGTARANNGLTNFRDPSGRMIGTSRR